MLMYYTKVYTELLKNRVVSRTALLKIALLKELLYFIFQLFDYSASFVTLFDGVCDQTKELQTLTGSMSNNVKWIISSSGRYMFVRFYVGNVGSSTGFLAKIHYGKL